MTPERAIVEIRELVAAGMSHLAPGVPAKMKARKIRTSMIVRFLTEASECAEQLSKGVQRWRFEDGDTYPQRLRVIVEIHEGALIVSAHWVE